MWQQRRRSPIKAPWCQNLFLPHCPHSPVEVHLMLWTKQDVSTSYIWGGSLDWRLDSAHIKNSKYCTRRNVLETHEIAADFTDQSHINTYRHYRPQRVLFLPDWTTAQTGKGGLYRSPPSGHNWGKTGYSWSKVTTKANAGKNNGGLQVRWSILLRQR